MCSNMHTGGCFLVRPSVELKIFFIVPNQLVARGERERVCVCVCVFYTFYLGGGEG